MEASQEHDKRPGRPRTLSPGPKGPPVVGSSCTWTRKELDLFRVQIEREVPIIGEMIPERYFEFEGLEGYELCAFP
jgi:hypothetical protein